MNFVKRKQLNFQTDWEHPIVSPILLIQMKERNTLTNFPTIFSNKTILKSSLVIFQEKQFLRNI